MQLPQESFLLLSFINMKLRDSYPTLAALCDDLDTDERALCEKLAAIGYRYAPQNNQFIAE